MALALKTLSEVDWSQAELIFPNIAMEGQRTVYFKRNGKMESKKVAQTPEGILSDNLIHLTNWQARIIYVFIQTGSRVSEVPASIDPDCVPNKRFWENMQYGPAFKREIQNAMKRYNPRTEEALKLMQKISSEEHLRKYVKALMAAIKKAGREPDNISVDEMERAQLFYYADKFETIYFPIAAARFNK